MKTTYKNYTITIKDGGHCALIFKGTDLSDEQLNAVDRLTKTIAGSSSDNAIEKAKQFIDTLTNDFTQIMYISDFVKFKKELIALKKYSSNSVIHFGTLANFKSRIFNAAGTKITVNFQCNSEVAAIFRKYIY